MSGSYGAKSIARTISTCMHPAGWLMPKAMASWKGLRDADGGLEREDWTRGVMDRHGSDLSPCSPGALDAVREQVAGGTLRFGRRQIGTINAPCGKHLESCVSGDSGSQPDWFQAMAKSRGVCYSAHVHAGSNSVSLLIVERPRKRDFCLRAFSMNPLSF